jgi:amidophosphoribosyltransferase
VLLDRIREVGGAKEIHVRVACPPIIAPCFYGIDMSRISELFAPPFVAKGLPSEEMFSQMAAELGADSLRYLPVEAIARAVGKPASQLCRACITGEYPTPHGQQLYQIALDNYQTHTDLAAERTYEAAATTAG